MDNGVVVVVGVAVSVAGLLDASVTDRRDLVLIVVIGEPDAFRKSPRQRGVELLRDDERFSFDVLLLLLVAGTNGESLKRCE